jgi:hypothetical protein
MPTTATAYGPYDAGAGANITEAFWRTFMARLSPSAVLAGVNNELAPSGDSTGMQAKVATGAAWVRGAYGEWTSGATTLAIAAVGGIAGGSERYDRLVVRNDFVNNRMELDVLTGTAGAAPTALRPALTQSSSVWEILLADVGPLNNATTTITAAMVIDGRWKMTESGILYHTASPTTGTSVRLPQAGSVPAGPGNKLVIEALARSSVAATLADLRLTVNGDSGNNYAWERGRLSGAAGGWGSDQGNSVAFATLGYAAGATAAANTFDFLRIEMPNFLATVGDKPFRGSGGHANSYAAAGLFVIDSVGWWFPAVPVAITDARLALDAGNFVTGSQLQIRIEP